MNEESTEKVDFCYPFKFEELTFVTRKPKYVPKILGIFQTLSLSFWITIVFVLFAMMLIYCICFKWKGSFGKILLNVFAILMKQNALITPSSLTEKLLILYWVVGSMLLCLSYDSVFLSFLSFPPVNKIKDLSDLASAVKKGDYHCLAPKHAGISWYFLNGKEESLKFIGKENLTYFVNTAVLGKFALSEKFFVSEDRFFQRLGSMMIRKGFCCKHLIDTFVHRLMA